VDYRLSPLLPHSSEAPCCDDGTLPGFAVATFPSHRSSPSFWDSHPSTFTLKEPPVSAWVAIHTSKI